MRAGFLSASKTRAPRPRAVEIARAELDAALDAALTECRLVLVSAAAGFGKTDALARRVATLGEDCAVAWVSADEYDGLESVFACLVEALEPYDLPWRVAPAALLSRIGTPEGQRSAVEVLADALDRCAVTHGVIVVDDLHKLADPRAVALIGSLVTRLPPQWTLAVTTRVDPPWPLAALHLRGELVEFREARLRFSHEEARQLAIASGKTLSEAQLDTKLSDTQGWPAGLVLSMDGADERVPGTRMRTRRHLFDYLRQEVLREMPPELREFLLACSVMAELTDAACAHVSGQPLAPHLLGEIERRGLFVSRADADERTLRLHDLFREFLYAVLQREQAERVPELLRRAAAIETDPVRQVSLLLRAGDQAQAEAVLLMRARRLITGTGADTVERLIEAFDPELRESSPSLTFLRGELAMARIDWPELHRRMVQALPGLEAAGMAGRAQEARALAALALSFLTQRDAATELLAQVDFEHPDANRALLAHCACWIAISRGRADEAREWVERTVERTPRPLSELSEYFVAGTAILGLGRETMVPAFRRLHALLQPVTEDVQGTIFAARKLLEASLLACAGEIEEADAAWLDAEAALRWCGSPPAIALPGALLRGTMLALRGDAAAAKTYWQGLSDGVRSNPRTRHALGNLVGMAVLQACREDDWSTVQALLPEMRGEVGRGLLPVNLHLLEIVPALQDLHEGRTEAAAAALREGCARSAGFDHHGFLSMLQIALARAELRLGRREAAWQAIAPLLVRARDTGSRLGLLLARPEHMAELARADWGPVAQPDLLDVLRALRPADRQAPTTPAAPGPRAPSLLSQRELEVIACIARGASNKEIARELDLSPHTVKRHVARILERLGIESRGQAAHWFVENHAATRS